MCQYRKASGFTWSRLYAIVALANNEYSPQQPGVIRETITLDDLADPVPGTFAYARAQQRIDAAQSVDAMPWLPQLPDAWATETYEQIAWLEHKLLAPDGKEIDYVSGTAVQEDELKIVGNQPEGVLCSAEHATCPVRTLPDTFGAPDVGTGGITALLAQNHGIGIIATGRQTSNASLVDQHPLKEKVRQLMPAACGYVSIHGMKSGKFVRPDDASGLHISIGLGENPAPQKSLVLAEKLVDLAYDLGLYAVIGNQQQYYAQLKNSVTLERNEDGSAHRDELAAFRPETTVNYVRGLPEEYGSTKAALQIEFASLLRLPIPGRSLPGNRRSEIVGVALGYRFMEGVVRFMQQADDRAVSLLTA